MKPKLMNSKNETFLAKIMKELRAGLLALLVLGVFTGVTWFVVWALGRWFQTITPTQFFKSLKCGFYSACFAAIAFYLARLLRALGNYFQARANHINQTNEA